MTDMTHIEASNSLADLAARIKAEHEATAAALQRGVEHAITAGELLLEAKAQLKHGQWLPWLAEHCVISERTAQLYMRLARNRATIEANPQPITDLTIQQVAALLAPAAPVQSMNPYYQFRVQLALIDPRIALTWTSMTLPEDLSREKYEAVGDLMKICFGPTIQAYEQEDRRRGGLRR